MNYGVKFFKRQVVSCTNFTGKSDAHIIQLDRNSYEAPNLKILSDKSIIKIFHYARSDLVFIKKT